MFQSNAHNRSNKSKLFSFESSQNIFWCCKNTCNTHSNADQNAWRNTVNKLKSRIFDCKLYCVFSFKCCCHQSIHKRGRTSTIKRTKMRTNASDWHTNNTIKCQMRTRWIAMEIENGLCLAIIRCRHRSKTTICSTIKTDLVLILFGCR